MKPNQNEKDKYEQEQKKSLDDLLKRMLTTPPKPHVKQEKKKPGK
jgi:hypothetical protein